MKCFLIHVPIQARSWMYEQESDQGLETRLDVVEDAMRWPTMYARMKLMDRINSCLLGGDEDFSHVYFKTEEDFSIEPGKQFVRVAPDLNLRAFGGCVLPVADMARALCFHIKPGLMRSSVLAHLKHSRPEVATNKKFLRALYWNTWTHHLKIGDSL